MQKLDEKMKNERFYKVEQQKIRLPDKEHDLTESKVHVEYCISEERGNWNFYTDDPTDVCFLSVSVFVFLSVSLEMPSFRSCVSFKRTKH